MTDVKPTRSELINLEKKIKLAKGGHSLLKRKRDGLIREFFDVLEEAKAHQSALSRQYSEATVALEVARITDGTMAVRSASNSLKHRPEVNLKTKNIMGVVVPEVQAEKSEKKFTERGYGIVGTSPSMDDAFEAYEKVLDSIIVAAEIETTMRRLLLEIERTKRRVNALEFSVIPTLESDASFIRLRLEEMERENIFRLKQIKKTG